MDVEGKKKKKKKKTGKALKKIGYFIIFFFQFYNVSACFRTDFSASWVPGGPMEPGAAQGIASV